MTAARTLSRTLRRAASHAKSQVFPAPEVAAWRRACRAAGQVSRYTPGEIALHGYRLEYVDLLTLCPQWHDIFVSNVLRFEAGTPDPRILDCGANVGLASLYFKRRYPRARITAFEADPAVARCCRANMVNNGCADVDVQAAAVWTEAGQVRFQREGADSGAIEGTSAGLGPVQSASVPAVRLADRLRHEERIDLLKLDIEGAEHAVLPDCADALGRVSAMLVDVHEFDPGRRRAPALLEAIASAGFRYAIDNVAPLPWRASLDAAPFPGAPAAWAMLVRAWRA